MKENTLLKKAMKRYYKLEKNLILELILFNLLENFWRKTNMMEFDLREGYKS